MSFKMSEDLREKIQDRLMQRMQDDLNNGGDIILSYLEEGFVGVNNIDGEELMDEYMCWHGSFSPEEDPEDKLLARMFDEFNAYKLEQAYLSTTVDTAE